MDLTTITQEEFLCAARKLRARADEAEREFLEFLRQAERVPALWAGAGHTFLQFLAASSLCDPARYDAYRRGMEVSGEKAEGVGVAAVIASTTLRTEEDRDELFNQARRFEATNGTTICDRTATKYARDIKMARVAVKHRTKGILDLDREIEALKAQLAERDTTIAALRAELKTLKSSMRAMSRSSRKTQVAAAG